MRVPGRPKRGCSLAKDIPLRFTGVWPVLPTPFRSGAPDELDVPALRRIVRHLRSFDVDGLWLLGSGGEQPNLDDGQRDTILQTVVEEADGLPLIGGVMEPGTAKTLRNVRRYAAAGVDGLHTLEPSFYRYEPTELTTHFLAVAEAAPVPTVAYLNLPAWIRPGMAAQQWLDALRPLVEHPNIVGMKVAAPDFRQYQLLLHEFAGSECHILTSSGRLLLASSLLGGDGGVFDDAAVVPAQYVSLWQYITHGEITAAQQLQLRLTPLGQAISAREHFGAKYALQCLGLCSAEMSSPFGRLSEHAEELIRQELAKFTTPSAAVG